MALNMEYIRKLEILMKQLEKRTYISCLEAPVCGFVTKERLSYEEACLLERHLYPEGTKWGKKWEYGWFFTKIIIPEFCHGKKVVFCAGLGESVVFVNGQVYGSLDREHTMITLAESAVCGEEYEIVMETFAGHGIESLDMKIQLRIPEEEMQELSDNVDQRVIKNPNAGIFLEDLFQLTMDLQTLYMTRNLLDDNSWRKANIDKCLKDVCNTIDIEAPIEKLREAVFAARELTGVCLSCKNGTSAPVMYAMGNSHLDLEWLWTKEETRRKAARTIGNQIRLMEEYDDYIYIHSQPVLLEFVKNEYPDLYEDVKKWVKKGRFVVEGGMWVEADTNIPGGESLIRQFIAGKKFMLEEFGIESEILWLPDVFGCSGNLPQIMKGCDIRYFLNAKVNWLYNGGEPLPYTNYIWHGIDGSEIFTHLSLDYASDSTPKQIKDKWDAYLDKEVPMKMFLYGHGDGGGGATRRQQEFIRREADLEGLPKVRMETPGNFFHDLENNYGTENHYVGEMYYATNRGTYTNQAKTKRLSRLSERALREAEMWSALFGCDSKKETDLLWKEVLFNHFHDVIPGSSRTEVHERAEKSFTEVIEKADVIADSARDLAVTAQEDCITVFNSLSWDRQAFVKLPDGYEGVCDADGKEAKTQRIGEQVWALLDAPSCGMKSWKLKKTADDTVESADRIGCFEQEKLILENDLIRAVFNDKGEMVSLTDKQIGNEYLSGPSNQFRMYQDISYWFDAWDIDSYYKKLEVECENDTVIQAEYNGALVSALLITRTMNESKIRQRVTLKKNSRHVDFETEVEWNETHKLLKVYYDTNIHTNELISEIQFGHVKRPNHRSRQYDADRFEVCQHRWSALAEGSRGFAMLNDCKYGIAADGGLMSLTLLRASTFPAMFSDRGVHKFSYSIMPYAGTFYDSDVIRQAYEFNYPVTAAAGCAAERSLIRISQKNVILESVKQAEDGSSDLIVRIYEGQNAYTICDIDFGFDVKEVYRANMLERDICREVVLDNQVSICLKAFEIVTLRVVTK